MISPRASAVHLDTSFLIRALVPGSAESERLRGWLRERRPVAVSALTWGEFLCGPLGEADKATARRIAHRHVPVSTEEVTEAARLFSHGRRRRGSGREGREDRGCSFPACVIAGTAIVSRAELATSNVGDFERFVDTGLTLAG